MRALIMVLLVGLSGLALLVVDAAASGQGETAQAEAARETFPPCPDFDLAGRPYADRGVNATGKPWCLYGLPNPCPVYWNDAPPPKARLLKNGQVKCVYPLPSGAKE